MLDDRPYMRPGGAGFGSSPMQQPWSGWAILLTINVVVFILQVMIDSGSLDSRFGNSLVGQWFAVDSEQISWLLPMQLITYQFFHGSVFHILVNALGLFFIGRALEPIIGRREIIGLYLVSGVVGAFFQLAFAMILPAHFAGPMVGASGAVFGFLGVLSRLFPQREMFLLLFFVLPVRLKLSWIFWGSFAIAIISIVIEIRSEVSDRTAHGAHLGGLLFGAFYVAALVRSGGLMRFLPGLPKVRFVSGDSAKGTEVRQRSDWRKPKVVDTDEVSGEDFISQEVDPILDKISKQGIHSLTERERKILEKARSKM